MLACNRSLFTTVATIVAVGCTAPIASARFDLNPEPTQAPSTPDTIVRVVHDSSDTGFDWGDAGIGAGGAIGLAALVLGGGVMASGRRRQRHSVLPS